MIFAFPLAGDEPDGAPVQKDLFPAGQSVAEFRWLAINDDTALPDPALDFSA
jgi:hypothetical protein